jgi:hypothetical protein
LTGDNLIVTVVKSKSAIAEACLGGYALCSHPSSLSPRLPKSHLAQVGQFCLDLRSRHRSLGQILRFTSACGLKLFCC